MINHDKLIQAARKKVKDGEPTTAEERLRARKLSPELEALAARYDNISTEELREFHRQREGA